jgi:hypothetical protein
MPEAIDMADALAGGLGFEPRLAESEYAVLPLEDPLSGTPPIFQLALPNIRLVRAIVAGRANSMLGLCSKTETCGN